MLKKRVVGKVLSFFRQKTKYKNQPGDYPPYPTNDPDKSSGIQWFLWSVLILVILLSLSAIVCTYAQAPLRITGRVNDEKGGQGIEPGQVVPDITIPNIHHYKSSSAKISDFRGKLLILDFWATWCSPCVTMIPRMDSLQKLFGDRVQFLSVAYQKENEVLPFLERLENQRGRHYNLPVATGDTSLRKLFPHTYLPHYVWIGTDGRVKAITEFKEVSYDNIRKILEEKKLTLALKKEGSGIRYNPVRPLFHINNVVELRDVPMYSVLTSYSEAIEGGGSYQDVFNKDSLFFRRITAYNVSMVNLFLIAAGRSKTFGWNRTVFQVRDVSRLRSNLSGQEYKNWLKNGNGYCYELVVPADKASHAYDIMWNDLTNYFTEYSVRLENKEVECLALQVTGDPSAIKSKGGIPSSSFDLTGCKITNRRYGLDLFTKQLGMVYMQGLLTPILNETNDPGPVDLEIIAPLNNPVAVNEALSKYGLQLKKVRRTLSLLVISDANVNY